MLLYCSYAPARGIGQGTFAVRFDFYGDTVNALFDKSCTVTFSGPLSENAILYFYQQMENANYEPFIASLNAYKEKQQLDDWLYYQLIRKAAQFVSPKADNYLRYTLYKWFFLAKSGYGTTLRIIDDKLLFYVQSDENVYEIPCYTRDGKQYVCLNYHDYGNSVNLEKASITEVSLLQQNAVKSFSYKVSQMPELNPADYQERDLQFAINDNNYRFKIKLNPQVQTMFANYPVVDYASYFDLPLSRETYESLVPVLKKNMKGLNVKNGIDYLMRFTRYAFLFEPDTQQFGKEKRLTPEQTLLYGQSDCEDRAALFFYLVKEIYNLPMIVMAYPQHVTIAVKFDKALGKPIIYNGERYTVCEPTPQKKDLRVGQMMPELSKETYEVVYSYHPKSK
ncbi:hypothetical protein [Foetidibacter luteolus]|uniref:hypothetical protein n=1 Tax=Foetidibacter luteolus TaxID=2608880 RepID=UPI00129B809B|nr:hypothetical protein [Foetidibacter luteolus]